MFEWHGGQARFRGAHVEFQTVRIGEQTFKMVGLKDAAELLDDPIFAKEFIEADRAPYGLELWPVSNVLAEHILRGEEGGGRPVLDLGCGLGMTAMAATLRGWKVMAADHDPGALLFAEHNALANGIRVDSFVLFDWHRPPSDRKFARVFGADILYQRTDQIPILKCLDAMLEPDGVAWIADPHRLSVDNFADLANQHGWSVELLGGATRNFQERKIQGRIFVLRRQ